MNQEPPIEPALRWRRFVAVGDSFTEGVGDPNLHTAPADAEAVTRLLGAREHRTFAGRLGKQDLDEEERAGVTSIQREEVDYRDWAAVRRWAAGIADTVLGEAAG